MTENVESYPFAICVDNMLQVAFRLCDFRMKGEAMSADGRSVNYAALKKSALYTQYKAQAEALLNVDLSKMTEAERMAFFISILAF